MGKFSRNEMFQTTSLFSSFRKKPFGFVDVGAAGGVHPLIDPISDLTACTCFEPNPSSYDEIVRQHANNSPFAQFKVYNTAISGQSSKQTLHLTKSSVCSSLLEPNNEVIDRYRLFSLEPTREIDLETKTLDRIFGDGSEALTDLIKLDCQGMEFEILQGAENILREQTVALHVEVEFLNVYKQQRLFPEICSYLDLFGFKLYGLYPHYLSTKRLDRTKYATQERISWGDAVFFKDPLTYHGKVLLDDRGIESLIMAAILMKFYDYAIELVDHYYAEILGEKHVLNDFILGLAALEKERFEYDLQEVVHRIVSDPDKAYLIARKFIDRNASNCDFDNITT